MSLHLHLHSGHLADAFIQIDLQYVHLSEERETIYITFGTVGMFIEPIHCTFFGCCISVEARFEHHVGFASILTEI